MKISHKRNQGLTLIEILVVVAIIAIIVSFGMAVDLNAFRRDTFRAEEATIVSLLSRARSRAMSNMFDTTHGVCYDNASKSYVVFRGSICTIAPPSELTVANVNIATTSDFANPAKFPTIVFGRLAGNTSSATITVKDGIKTADIKINNEGTISW